MEEEIEIILRAIDEASDTFQGISDSVSDMSSSLSDVGDSASSASDGIDGVAESGEGAGDAMDSMSAAADAFTATALLDFAQQVSDTLWNLADSAGNVRDSMDRASLEAEGFGLSASDMKGVLSDVANETGRAGGQIRESFIKATARGVTDMDAFKSMMAGAGAQAYLFGTDIQSMADKFSTLAFNTNLMPKALKETGITMDELATAMGMTGATADEVKEKWKELDANQRAAALGMAASMNEAEDANDHYKHSWEGLQAQVDKAKAKLEVMVGNVLLPVLIPALEAAARVLDWFGNVLGAVMEGPLGGFISVVGSIAGGIAIAVPAIAALTAAIDFMKLAIMPAIAESWALLAPWLPWIALGAAIIAIIYEIGIAFGWWTDASSMIDAIGAGLQRMWNAFINHPDVQAAISAISSALSTLWSYIQQAGQAVMEFFGISTSGDFDIVHALIVGLGYAWEILKTPIMGVIEVVQGVIWAFEAVTSAGESLNEGLSEVWDGIMGFLEPYIQNIIDLVTGLVEAFDLFKSGQMDLPSLIITVLGLVWNAYLNVITLITSAVSSFAMNMLTQAVTAGRNFLNGIVTWISQLPGRVSSFMSSALSMIISIAGQWVSNAVSKASSLVSQVASTLSGLPGRISSALSGVVNAIVKPFQDAYNRVAEEVDKIKSKASEVSGIAFGGETAYAGEGLLTSDYSIGESSISVDVNEHITLDLVNVPAHIDTNTLINMLSDRNVLRALTGNRTFQDLDSQVKNEILRKSLRANGG